MSSIDIKRISMTPKSAGPDAVPQIKKSDQLSEEDVDVLLSQLPEEEEYTRLTTIPGKKFRTLG